VERPAKPAVVPTSKVLIEAAERQEVGKLPALAPRGVCCAYDFSLLFATWKTLLDWHTNHRAYCRISQGGFNGDMTEGMASKIGVECTCTEKKTAINNALSMS
jgi:hypothetical protein